MRRRNVGGPRLCALLDSGGYIHAVLVHGNRNQTAARALENAARQAVAGSSIQTGLPLPRRTRADISRACWEPATTITWLGSQRTALAVRR